MKFIVFQEIILENKRLEPKKWCFGKMMFKFQLGDFWGATGAVHFFPETRFRRSKNLETPEAQTQEFSKNLACKAVDVIKACWKGIHISAREKKEAM